MRFDESSPSMTTLWRITAAVAILLLAITLLLVIKARSQTSSSFTAYISGQNTTVYLRNQPEEASRINAILNHGAVINVDYSTSRDGITWYRVHTENDIGWIPESNLSLTKP
jgi:SH3-like domain-containing protein